MTKPLVSGAPYAGRVGVRTSVNPWVQRSVATLDRFNARHPWSHNDHFHPWIRRNLPAQRRLAVDVGCGRGLLVSRLASGFEQVIGIDSDAAMRAAAADLTATLTNVTITDAPLPALPRPADLVTMVAVLHHLPLEDALAHVRDALAPGGRFLAVGLAPPVSARDHAWDVASALTNPVIGLLKHPRTAGPRRPDDYPTTEPAVPFDELAAALATIMPAARIRHRLAFRHTITWAKPPR